MSTSYPFLQIARETSSNYGDVLSYADSLELPAFAEMTFWQKRALERLSYDTMTRIIKLVTETLAKGTVTHER